MHIISVLTRKWHEAKPYFIRSEENAAMNLREILVKLSEENIPILLNDGEKDWEAQGLLETLSKPVLNRDAYMQPGLYIAEINSGGYLGQVLYKLKQKN